MNGKLRFALVAGMALAASAMSAQQTWRRSIGGWGPDEAAAVVQLPSGTIAVAGSTGSFNVPGGDAYLLFLDDQGTLLSSRTWGTAGVDRATAIGATDAGFFIAGHTNGAGAGGYDGFVATFTADGQELWRRFIGSTSWDFLADAELAAEGYYLTGTTYATPGGDADIWVVRMSTSGDTLWTRKTGSAGDDAGWGVRACASGGCAVAGEVVVNDSTTDGILLRYASTGELLWSRTFPGIGSEAAHAVAEGPDGALYVTGVTNTFYPYDQVLLAKVGPDGSLAWSTEFGFVSDWEAWDIALDADGDVHVAGSSSGFGSGGWDMYLLITDGDGQFAGGRTYGGIEDEHGYGVVMALDGGVIVAGSSTSYGPGIMSAFIVKGDTAGFTFPETVETVLDPVGIAAPERNAPRIFPTLVPEGGAVRMVGVSGRATYRILDASGREWRIGSTVGSADEIQLQGLPRGAYIVEVQPEEGPLLRERLVIQ